MKQEGGACAAGGHRAVPGKGDHAVSPFGEQFGEWLRLFFQAQEAPDTADLSRCISFLTDLL